MRAGKEGRSRYGLWKFCSHLFFFCNLVSDILELCALKNVEITDYFYSFFLPSPEVNRKWLWFCGLLSLHALWYLHLCSHCMKLPDFWRCQSLPTNRPHGPSGCAQMPPTALGSDTSIPHRGEPDLCAHIPEAFTWNTDTKAYPQFLLPLGDGFHPWKFSCCFPLFHLTTLPHARAPSLPQAELYLCWWHS